MVARVEDAVILADQFVSGVRADSAKLVVHVGNRAPDVRTSDDRMLIEGKLLIGDILFGSLAIGNISADGDVLAWFALRAHERDDGGVYPVDGAIFGPVFDLTVPNLPAAWCDTSAGKTPWDGGQS